MFITRFSFLILLTVFSLNSHAFNNSRDGKWAFFLSPQLINAKVLQFDNGSEANINDRSSLGFGLGYNLDRHIELHMTFSSSSANYTGTRILDDGANTKENFSANLFTSSISFGATYNFFSTPFTPYVSANIGGTYIDSGIPTGNLSTACWWDPWFGYRCSPTAETYTATKLNYGFALGVRYDFNRKLYFKADIAQSFLDVDSINTPDFTAYRLTFGFMF